MCGILGYIFKNSINFDKKLIIDNFLNLSGRGPDSESFNYYKEKYFIGFCRLSIIDTSPKGNQPFIYYYDNIRYTCICNGEIYNAESTKKEILNDMTFNSNSDCEVLIPLYIKYKEKMFDHLDGVFSFIIIVEDGNSIEYFIARDRIGVRPLYIGYDYFDNIVFSSELKGMKDVVKSAKQFNPGHYMKINDKENIYKSYYEVPVNYDGIYKCNLNDIEQSNILKLINNTLTNCVNKRLISDRPVCALLSGGLDSSLVCSIASKILKEKGLDLYTFSIGIEGSPDNIYAQKVADFIGSKHTVITLTSEDAINALESVIWATETYDITTIRASTGQYLVSKYIAENTDFKVVLSGDGSDEVTSGYLENYNAPDDVEMHKNAIERIKNIHYYDVQRADRATSIHGLELRVPFLDVSFVNMYLNIDKKLRLPRKNGICEKFLLRKAFENGYLPNDILWRRKEAFSDGISSTEKSWYEIIQDNCERMYTDEYFENLKCKHNFLISKESLYYKEIFEKLYSNKFGNIIPEYWMPKWSNTNDPSARTLEIYN